jgi:cytochrome bd-type quinol oxidase subunit 2
MYTPGDGFLYPPVAAAFFCVFGAPISDGIYFMFQIVTGIGIAGISLSGRLAGWSISKLSGYAFAFSCIWMTLLGPVTEKATYIVIAPLLCWLIVDDRQRNQNKWFVAYLLCYIMGFLTQVISQFPSELQGEYPISRALLPI